MKITDIIRERAVAEAINELCALARKCDNLWALQEAIAALKPRDPKEDL